MTSNGVATSTTAKPLTMLADAGISQLFSGNIFVLAMKAFDLENEES